MTAEPIFLFSAFLAGIFTFLAPCTFPLVPAFLAFIGGVDPKELEAQPEAWKKYRWKIFKHALFYVVGFTLIFLLFGIGVGILGQFIAPIRTWASRIGGIFVIILGLFMLGVLKIPFLLAERQIAAPHFIKRPGSFGSFVIGAVFALGWSPCVGPILGSILFLATTQGTFLTGFSLLFVFSLGLAIPFLVTALIYGNATKFIQNFSRFLKIVSIIAGLFLILLGILLVTDQYVVLFNKFRAFFIRFEFFRDFINRFL